MREILFRGKRRDNGEWVYGNLLRHTLFMAIKPIASGRFSAVDPETVGQFTGKCDKNCVKIFEGDIVEYRNSRYVIRYLEKYTRFAGTNSRCVFAGFNIANSEVIGNVFDNPELLEVEE